MKTVKQRTQKSGRIAEWLQSKKSTPKVNPLTPKKHTKFYKGKLLTKISMAIFHQT
jgi:predicted XRE-type DNA-binding protein